jgi:hypothetical protein
MIGLVDLQLQSWDKPQLCPPNLEIMKLATYYQQEENKFCRLINLDEKEFGGYEKVYVFSESKDFITVPEAFKRSPNVVYGGTAFTNGKYIPFENKLIDYTIARPRIYAAFLKDKYQAGLKDIEIKHLLDNSYYRWHAGDNELPLPSIQKRHRLYIYDKDFFQEGWRTIINKILNRNPSSINFIHPAHYKKISDFLEVRENGLIAKGNDAYLDLDIPLRETPVLMKHYKNRLLAVIRPSSQIYLSIGGSFHYQSEYFKNIIYKLNLLYTFWSHNIPIKLKYEEPELGCYNPISDLSKMISTWTQGESCNYKSIIDRIPKDKRMTDIRPEREQLRIILDKYPSSEALFRQTIETIKKGGHWKYGH